MVMIVKKTNDPLRWLRLIEAKKHIKKTTDLDISITRLRYWIAHGLVNHSGYRVLLRARKRFGQWWVTDKWLDEFIKEVSE